MNIYPLILLLFLLNIGESESEDFKPSYKLKNENVKSIGFLQTFDHFIKEDPNKPIPVYNKPNGDQLNEIWLTVVHGLSSHYLLTPNNVDPQKIQQYDKSSDTKHIAQYYNLGKGQVVTKFYANQHGYVKILAEQFDNYWVKLADIDQYVKPTTYAEFIAQHTFFQIANYQNYRLRKGPSLQDDIIMQLNENKYSNQSIHIITEFKQVKGSWAYAVVYEINEHIYDCYGKDEVLQRWTGNTYEGWIKLVDDDGQFKDIYIKTC